MRLVACGGMGRRFSGNLLDLDYRMWSSNLHRAIDDMNIGILFRSWFYRELNEDYATNAYRKFCFSFHTRKN